MTDIKKVAFIGTGIMGRPMAAHLMDAGYELTVYNRTAAKAQPLVERGARLASTPGEAAADADVVFTMVGYPQDVEDVYLAGDGVIACAKKGAYLIDMTTSSPQLAHDIHDAAEVSGLHAFDAPVTGGQAGAEAGTLTIFCGATEETIEPVLPLLRAMGAKVLAFGDPGSGQVAKLSNQVALAGCMLGMVEGLTFARESGLDVRKVYDALLTGTAESAVLHTMGPKVLEGDFTPSFMVKHYVKDLNLALSHAEDEEVTLPAAETAAQLYTLLEDIGGGEMGTQALSLVYDSEERCAQAGLDWSKLDEPDEDEAAEADECGCGCHDHAHDHAHGHECTCEDASCSCHDHDASAAYDDDDDDEDEGGIDFEEFEAPFSRN